MNLKVILETSQENEKKQNDISKRVLNNKKMGRNDGFMTSTEDLSTLTIKKNNFDKILKSKKALSAIVGGLILISLILLLI